MAWTQTDLDKLDRAIAKGQLKVRFADRQVEYQTTDDLLKARAAISAELSAQSSGRSGPRFSTAQFND